MRLCSCTQYNTRSDWLIVGYYFLVVPAGRLRVGLQKQNKNRHNKQLINLKRSVLKESLLLGQYGKVSVGVRFSHEDFTFG